MLKDLTEGKTVKERVLVKNTEQKMGTRGPYTTVTMTDGEIEVSANVWTPLSSFPYKGKVVDVQLTVRNGFINVAGAEEVPEADITCFVPHAPIEEQSGMNMIRKNIDAMTDHPYIQKVCECLIEENEEQFSRWSAAKTVHHNYLRGLLYHTCRMLSNVKHVAYMYRLDTTLLSAGVILHDIGKLKELDMDDLGTTTYTKKGNLFGHLYLGTEMINDACTKLGIDRETEEIVLLKHLILSHHKEQEFGAVKKPAVKEAYVLALLDDMDSKIWIYENAYAAIEPGECGAPVYSLGGTAVYRPDFSEET